MKAVVELDNVEVDNIDTPVATLPGRTVHSAWKRNLLTFLMVAGPGLIVMEADNDAGAVSTYVQAGAQYGTHLLWLLLFLLPITYFVQEMVARLGIATGQGHAAMIYRRFGKWWGRFSLVDLLVVNFLTLVTEFAAIALAFDRLGVDPRLAVPLAAVALIAMGFSGSYLRWERATIVLCLLDLTWLVLAFVSHPSAAAAAHDAIVPHIPPGGLTLDLVFLIVAVVGTTIAPWQLFFQQSCVADKRLRFSDLKWERLDTMIGAAFTIIVAGCMMLVGDLAKRHGLPFTDPAQMAQALIPAAGYWFRTAVLLMMVNAAVLGTTAISLASSWAYGEVMGWPHSLQKKVSEAPGFYLVYALCVLAAAGVVLIPRAPLQLIIISVQVLAGLMLPSAIIFLQLLLNDKELLGEEFVNKRWNNWVNWTIITILFVLSLVLAVQVLLPGLLPHA
ncbi:MAG TPA: Nramp family divalent metal transporter [Blastocatellia bacterium]